MGKKVLVILETKDGKLRHVSLEALSVGQTLSAGGQMVAVLFGPDSAAQVGEVSKYGPAKLYVVEGEAFASYTTDAFLQAAVQLVQTVEPDIILLGHTAIGKDLAPRLASRLGIGLLSDCTRVLQRDGQIVFERPIYAGKAFQQRVFQEGTLFATLRSNNFETNEQPCDTELIPFQPTVQDIRTTIRQIVRKTAQGVDLSEAKIIVSGGRGVKSAEGFKVLKELADLLGGAVGASRGACDAGYCDYGMQIGQTGKVVTPDLYIACGISGAIQHLAGMSNSKCIVAINKDPEAPIFQVADYGIVGDLFEVVPLLKEEFSKILQTH
ncbi:electron transfer flavoprotein subunit alpha/FixB family protein [Brevibacillus fulvus]|uniref:Electron transfer flavoprotein alpha subunit n=1 Tax=Brevibacillus fulvus TaxID=1125967 RepID=A0A938XYF7_9BACL|nr:electron transfer flavoprotein subunit alpha/FixB family protein [Brevibacillus fulvus]MBM7589214.1 electron transfer flavoprotein alpha subunit [Brevibacillus fulvus]